MPRKCVAVLLVASALWARHAGGQCSCPDEFPLRLVGTTTLQIAVAWDAVPAANQYVIERSTSCNFAGAATYAVSSAVTAYGDTGKAPNDRFRFHAPSGLVTDTDYFYRVRAVSAQGNLTSGCVSARLASGPTRGVTGDLWADVVLGQPDFGQNDFRKTTAEATQWAGGVVIDRGHTPQRLYVADANHNRVLGYPLSGQCTGTGTNLAVGRSYSKSLVASPSYPDTGNQEFTDGQLAQPWWMSTNSFGYLHGSGPLTVDIDIDLGALHTINTASLDNGAGTDHYTAASFELLTSTDAQQWTSVGLFDNPNRALTLDVSFAATSTRYVRFRVNALFGCQDCDWLFLGEGKVGYTATAGQPCTTDTDCDGESTCTLTTPLLPSIVLGQPSFVDGAACNFDGTGQLFPERAPAQADSMCLIEPLQISIGETVFGAMMDVDDQGALYVPDTFNNRVLKFDDPFATDAVADDVWGQADFSGNLCNRGGAPAANTLCREGYHNGVAIDDQGNLWVSDPGNARVLRFPRSGTSIAHTADRVLGQPGFTSSSRGTGLSQMQTAYDVVYDRATQRLYVADAGDTPQTSRILEFAAPFTSGMAARRALPISFYCDFNYPGLVPISLAMDSQTHGLWVENNCFFTELFDLDTPSLTVRKRVKVLQTQGVDVDRDGNLFVIGKWSDLYRFPRSSLGLDYSANDYLKQSVVTGGRGPATADAFYSISGVAQLGTQLIVADAHRLLIWNNFDVDTISSGAPADDLLGEASFDVETFQQYFAYPQTHDGQLWVQRVRGGVMDILVFDPPLSHSSVPVDVIPLTPTGSFSGYPVLGCPGDPRCNCAGDDCSGNNVWMQSADWVDFDVAAGGDEIWVADRWNSRVLRIANRLHQRNAGGLFVDVILGQANLAGTSCNRNVGPLSPSAQSLCYVYDLTVDAIGNLYVGDNGGEGGSNMRLLEFEAPALTRLPGDTTALFGVQPARVFGTGGDYTHVGDRAASDPIISPFKPIFHPSGHLVIGNNPYSTQRFPVVFTNPLAEQLPQLILGDFTSYPAGSSFIDANGNLFFSDSNWARLLIYKDPFRVLGGGQAGPTSTSQPTRTRTATPTVTVTPTPECVGGVAITTPRLRVTRDLDPAGDETVRVSGRLDFGSPPALDPVTDGFRLTLLDQLGAVVFSRTVPAGGAPSGAPGWHVGRDGRHWTFTDSAGTLAGGLRRVTIALKSNPTRVTFTARGRASAFQVRPSEPPLQLRVVFGGTAQGMSGQCGATVLNASGGPIPACRFSRMGALLTCR